MVDTCALMDIRTSKAMDRSRRHHTLQLTLMSHRSCPVFHSFPPPTFLPSTSPGAPSGIGHGAGWVAVSPALLLIVCAVVSAALPTFEAREEASMLAPEHFTKVVSAVSAHRALLSFDAESATADSFIRDILIPDRQSRYPSRFSRDFCVANQRSCKDTESSAPPCPRFGQR